MEKTTEPEIRQAIRTNMLTRGEIWETDGGFIFVVEMAWKEEPARLYALRRNRVRSWATLDAVTQFLKRIDYPFPEILVKFRQKENPS